MCTKKLVLFTLCFLFYFIGLAQFKSNPTQFIGINIGRSIHGTGDMRGITYNTVYSNKFRKRLSWIATFGGTLHDGSWDLFFADPNGGKEVDGSIRYTTGGIQSTFGVNYNFVETAKSDIYIGLNGLLRYQTTSYYDDVKTIYPIVTGLPFPVISFSTQYTRPNFCYWRWHPAWV